MPSATRFFLQFARPDSGAVAREDIPFERDGAPLEASLYHPSANDSRPRPCWIALHGVTHRGRHHESLDGLARALAASGTRVLVPDVPEWRDLTVAPAATHATLEAAVDLLETRPDVLDHRVGVLGFSFGGTQALLASTRPELRDRLSAVVSWGAYADFHRVVRFAFTGEHELDGQAYHLDPDPYGRWILTGQYLARVPGREHFAEAAGALHELAREVGRRKILAWTPATDPIKERLQSGLAPEQRRFFELLAPPTSQPVADAAGSNERRQLRELAAELARTASEIDPELEPGDRLGDVAVPVFLAHGRDDRLMPWTELERMSRALPGRQLRHAMVTGLFGHSFREGGFPGPSKIVEGFQFILGMRRMITLV